MNESQKDRSLINSPNEQFELDFESPFNFGDNKEKKRVFFLSEKLKKYCQEIFFQMGDYFGEDKGREIRERIKIREKSKEISPLMIRYFMDALGEWRFLSNFKIEDNTLDLNDFSKRLLEEGRKMSKALGYFREQYEGTFLSLLFDDKNLYLFSNLNNEKLDSFLKGILNDTLKEIEGIIKKPLGVRQKLTKEEGDELISLLKKRALAKILFGGLSFDLFEL